MMAWRIGLWDVRRATRERTFWLIPLCAIPLMASFQQLNFFGVAVGAKVITDFSLSVIHAAGLLVAAALASTSLTSERERKTSAFVLSKPVSRGALVTGKFGALGLVLGMVLAILGLQLTVMSCLHGGHPDPGVAAAIVLELLGLLTYAALVMLISAGSSLLMTVSLAVLLAGVTAEPALIESMVGGGAPPAFRSALAALLALLPDLSGFDVSLTVVHGHGVPPVYVGRMAVYAFVHIAVYLSLAGMLLARSEA